jgi:hypothetical protein
LLLAGVTYYQVVFTLPSDLSELALANRHAMAELLSTSAWKSLSKNIKDEQDYEPAGISVLHTWNQQLEAHWHVHVLVRGRRAGDQRAELATSDRAAWSRQLRRLLPRRCRSSPRSLSQTGDCATWSASCGG